MKALVLPGSLIASHPVFTFLLIGNGVFLAASVGPRLEIAYDLPLASALGTILGVGVAAFLVTAAVAGRDGVNDLVRRSILWRVSIRWYIFVLLLVPAGTTLLALALYGGDALAAPDEGWPRALGATLAVFLLQLVVFNLPEEIGWSGFLQERLRHRYSALGLAAVIAFLWAVWHIPEFFADEGWSPENVVPAFVFLGIEFVLLFFARALMIWVYCRTGLSVLMVGLFHASFNATISQLSFNLLPDTDAVRFVLVSAVVCSASAAVIVGTRGRFSEVRN